MKSCSYHNCKIPAEFSIVWGPNNSKGDFCFYHVEQLWEKYKADIYKTHESLNWKQFSVKDSDEPI